MGDHGRRRWLKLVLGSVLLSCPPLASADGVRGILERAFAGGDVVVAGEPVAGGRLGVFYAARDYAPVWSGPGGPTHDADALVEALRGARAQGLDPDAYHLAPIVSRLSDTDPERLAELDVLLSDAFLRYCFDLRSGRADPRDADPEWFFEADHIDHLAALEQALADHSVAEVLGRLAPPDPSYGLLQAALRRYRSIAAAGGWPRVGAGRVLRRGDRGPEVGRLADRLSVTGDTPQRVANGFGPELEAGVRRFQTRHGLAVDGVVGPRTLRALDVSVGGRIHQLVLNMERWRWMPRRLGGRYVVVNMAGFELQVVEGGRTWLTMPVIVGRAYRRTPAFSEKIRYLVINPFWNVPPTLAGRDLLPKILDDPGFLAREGIRVFSDWGAGARELDPAEVDWTRVSPEDFPFKLRQDPGPRNALGRIKFMLPNRFNVYLHDTPHQDLFDRPVRTFSSGCIRLARPEALAVELLRDVGGWDGVAVGEAVAAGERAVIRLRTPVPVYLVYWTAWVDGNGVVQFRDDVYGRDGVLADALARGRRPASGR